MSQYFGSLIHLRKFLDVFFSHQVELPNTSTSTRMDRAPVAPPWREWRPVAPPRARAARASRAPRQPCCTPGRRDYDGGRWMRCPRAAVEVGRSVEARFCMQHPRVVTMMLFLEGTSSPKFFETGNLRLVTYIWPCM